MSVVQEYLDSNLKDTYIEGNISDVPELVEFLKNQLEQIKPWKVLHVGFNAGHSAEIILNTDSVCSLVSIDLGIHTYVAPSAANLSSKIDKELVVILGDSRKQLKVLHNQQWGKFDMIYLDGGSQHSIVEQSIIDCIPLSHENTVIMLNGVDKRVDSDRPEWCEGPTLTWLTCTGELWNTEQPNLLIEHDYCPAPGVGRGAVTGKFNPSVFT
jgi:predicted O-methyltransferase YrrM